MKLVSKNPSRDYEVIGQVQASSEHDVGRAVEATRAAWVPWRDMGLTERCRYVAAFVGASESRLEEIARMIAMESGWAIADARENVEDGIRYLRAYLEMAAEALTPQVSSEGHTQLHRVYREPWGVMAVICSWNYPFMSVAWQCGQALLAGNAIVYKQSEETPLLTQLFAELMATAGMPTGVFTVLYGGDEVNEWLAQSNVDVLSYAGNVDTGQKLSMAAEQRMIPVIMEVRNAAPAIVFEDADVDGLADYIFRLRFKNASQACDEINRLIVHESRFDEVVQKLRGVVEAKHIGDALNEATDIGPIISKEQLEIVEGQVQDALIKGAAVALGGERPAEIRGAYYLPTILTGVTTDMRVWREDVFGPILPVMAFASEGEAIELANGSAYTLSAHVMTLDHVRFERVASKIRARLVAQNAVPFWDPHNPFGGAGKSGIGRLHGAFDFEAVTWPKLVSEEK